jgi:hypothetical protein
MNRRWVGVTLVAASLAAACGQGHAILSVDVYSFLKGTGKDTVPYLVPPGVSNFAVSNKPQKINLVPGVGSSLVDTVKLDGTANLENTAGSGTIGFQVYLAADSGSAAAATGTYAASARVFSPAPTGSPLGPGTTPIVFGIPNLSATLDSLLTKTAMWIRIVAVVSNPAPPAVAALQGKMVLKALQLRVVVQDKIF